MNSNEEELYNYIYASFIKHRVVDSKEEKLFVHELTLEAVEGALEYIEDMSEAIGHLMTTIKMLSKENSLDTV